MSRISPRDQRLLIGMLLLVAGFFGFRPLSAAYRDARDGIADHRRSLSAELSLLQNATRYPELYTLADSNLRSVIPQLFLEQDDVLATVALQQHVDNMARSSSVLVTQARNQPAQKFANGLRSLRVEIQAESDLEGIMEFLDRLETGTRLIHVTSVEMRPGSSESGIASNEKAIKLNANIVGFGIDTSIVRGHTRLQVAPPRAARKAR